jgi:hypothetical protein
VAHFSEGSTIAGATTTERGGVTPLRGDITSAAYWISLGAAAGGLGGLVAGGIGGRVGMFVLRLTSDDSVRGLESDDGFVIGRFDFTSTLSLLFVTMFLGSLFGLFVVLGRPFFARRWMPGAWAVAGATVGGAILIHDDGVDFTLIEPHWLAVAMFIAIPAAGAGLIAWLVERLHDVWWNRRKTTAAVALAAIPAVIFFPIAVAAVLGGILWVLASRVPEIRRAADRQAARVAAAVVFVSVVLLSGVALVGNVAAVL